MSQHRWKFNVSGWLVREPGAQPLGAFNALVESAVRDASSPYELLGVGPMAQPDANGRFATYFVTQGADRPIEPPETVTVFVRAQPGAWDPYIVDIQAQQVTPVSAGECIIDLGPVLLQAGQSIHVP